MKKFILSFGLVLCTFFSSVASVGAYGWGDFEDSFKDAGDKWLENAGDNAVDGMFGQSGPDGKFELPAQTKFGKEIGANDSARTFILNVVNFILSFLGLLAVAVVIYAGFTYVTAAGDDSKAESAKKMILYAVVGILVVLGSFAIVNTVIKEAGTGGADRSGGSVESEDFIGELEAKYIIKDYKNCKLNDVKEGATQPIPEDKLAVIEDSLNCVKAANILGDKIIVNTKEHGFADVFFYIKGTDEEAGISFGDGMTDKFFPNIVELNVDPVKAGTNQVYDTSSTTAERYTNVHRFESGKDYTINVGAEDASGNVVVGRSKLLIIDPVKGDFGVDRWKAEVGGSINLDGSLSKARYGTVQGYAWTVTISGETGERTDDESCILSDALSMKTKVSCSTAGKREVSLTVTDGFTMTDVMTKTVEFGDGDAQYRAEIQVKGDLMVDGVVNLDGRGSTGSEGMTLAWECVGLAGADGCPKDDKALSTLTGNSAFNPGVSFTEAGRYEITLTLSEGTEVKSTKRTTINISEAKLKSMDLDFSID